ncbi:LysE family translocator [Amycolatopsis mongoliensis]|uniref:LysE family translocator n=1 Tax=Amycolatopsis mongoliensis TaxID=715475 RepID=A0A9Y2JV68_9PSEU|nr:LysE family translocator [Amycolatopsis sp. 4-36]WIY05240.1 LysE family translocator [Amycolatopsis sp. 4-36]
MPNLLAFIPAAFLIAMVPGPATVMLIKQAARGSKRNAFATIAGIEAGVAFWGLAAVFGLTAVLAASRTAYDVLRIAGAIFLVCLGIKALFFRGSVEEKAIRPGAGFRSGLVTNIGNPKAGVFALSFLPQFVPAHAGAGALLACVAACGGSSAPRAGCWWASASPSRSRAEFSSSERFSHRSRRTLVSPATV